MRGPSLTKEITKDTPGAVYVPSAFGGQGGPTKAYYREKTNQELQHVIGAQDAATRAAGPPAEGMVFHGGAAWNPMSDAKPTPGYWAYPSTKGFFGDTLGNILNIGKTVAPIAAVALGANYLLPSLMGTGAAAAGGAGGAELLGAEALAGGAGGASAAPALTPAAIESLIGTAGYGTNASALAAAPTLGASTALVGSGGAGLPNLTPAAIDSLVGTPGYGVNASATDFAINSGLNPANVGANAYNNFPDTTTPTSTPKTPTIPKASTTSTTPDNAGGLSALALAALLASMNKGSGTDDSYKGTIPEYEFSRTKNARPKDYRAGQGNVTYFTPGTYTKKAAGGGLMELYNGGEMSQFDFAERDNYPSMVGSGYPSREGRVDQGGIVQQTNPQFAGLGSLYQSSVPPQNYNMAQGGAVPGQYNLGSYSDGGRLLKGPGDGVSDSIPAIIGKKQPARLATGEFVIPARIVSELGNGSTGAGAKRLYEMMNRIQQTRRKTKNVAANTNASKYLPA